jgi:hypothetical protein
MNQIPLYPLRFEPIYQYRLWGGRRLANLLSAPLPEEKSIGEAWILSDRDDHPSLVADGPLKGTTIVFRLRVQLPLFHLTAQKSCERCWGPYRNTTVTGPYEYR